MQYWSVLILLGTHSAATLAAAKAHSVLQSPFAPIVAPVPLTQIQLNVYVKIYSLKVLNLIHGSNMLKF